MSLSLFRQFARAAALIAIVLVAPALHAQESSAAKPEAVIREFYAWYVKAAAANRNPQSNARLKRFVTTRFLREIDKAGKVEGGIGADPFLQAQDVDEGWAKNIKVSEPKISGETATSKVELKGSEMGAHKLNVTMRSEGGAWKVDKVDMP